MSQHPFQHKFVLFLFFPVTPTNFYLYLNFLDTFFNNFNFSKRNEFSKNTQLENLLIQFINDINQLLITIAVLSFLIFIIYETYRTIFHQIYAITRLIICMLRFILLFIFFCWYFKQFLVFLDIDF